LAAATSPEDDTTPTISNASPFVFRTPATKEKSEQEDATELKTPVQVNTLHGDGVEYESGSSTDSQSTYAADTFAVPQKVDFLVGDSQFQTTLKSRLSNASSCNEIPDDAVSVAS
jgi:hypothetical protein